MTTYDILDANGLQIQDLNDTLAILTTAFQTQYGLDINLDSNTPDGQLINISSQIGRDNRELALNVYNSFDITKCIGIILDIRVALLGITRKGGTYTQIPVDITVDRTTTLQGLDDNYNNSTATSYTVSDSSGNQFYLIDTVTLTAGTTTVNFRAKDIGTVTVATDTVTTQSTIVLGVTAVNNSSGAIQTGENQETDSELRLRAERSYGISAKGYLNGLESALLNLIGVTEAKVYENVTNDIDEDGIPAHGIWAIVEGGASADIAQTIYKAKSGGCNMKGSTTYDITTISGNVYTYRFDRPIAEDLYIRFDLKPTTTGVAFDTAAIKTYMEENLTYTLNEYAETSKVTTSAIDAINASTGYGVPLNVEVSTNGSTWVDYVTPTAKNYEFTVSADNITITEI